MSDARKQPWKHTLPGAWRGLGDTHAHARFPSEADALHSAVPVRVNSGSAHCQSQSCPTSWERCEYTCHTIVEVKNSHSSESLNCRKMYIYSFIVMLFVLQIHTSFKVWITIYSSYYCDILYYRILSVRTLNKYRILPTMWRNFSSKSYLRLTGTLLLQSQPVRQIH